MNVICKNYETKKKIKVGKKNVLKFKFRTN